jgi:hypothetical protein
MHIPETDRSHRKTVAAHLGSAVHWRHRLSVYSWQLPATQAPPKSVVSLYLSSKQSPTTVFNSLRSSNAQSAPLSARRLELQDRRPCWRGATSAAQCRRSGKRRVTKPFGSWAQTSSIPRCQPGPRQRRLRRPRLRWPWISFDQVRAGACLILCKVRFCAANATQGHCRRARLADTMSSSGFQLLLNGLKQVDMFLNLSACELRHPDMIHVLSARNVLFLDLQELLVSFDLSSQVLNVECGA